jgi:nucleoside-diphosphate-sugar epimerase
MEDNKKNRILVFGGSGYIGKYVVKASISLGYPTFVYTRPINSQTSPSTKQLCEEFHSIGVTIVEVISFSLDKSLFF